MADHTKVPVADVRDGQVVDRRIAEKFSSEQFADAAVDFLKSRSGDGPFFCYVAFTAPHDPRNPPEPFRQMYYRNRPSAARRTSCPSTHSTTAWLKDIRDENLAPYPRTRKVIGDQLCEYYGLITHLDEQVGRILAALEESGHAADTIIIYTADHGLALGSHGLLGKQSLYEHSMRSPLIIAGPGIPAGRSTAAFTYLFDLFPTICPSPGSSRQTGWPAGTSGRSGRARVPRSATSVFLPFSDLMRSVRDERLEAHRLPADQPPPVIRPAGRSPGDAGPRR